MENIKNGIIEVDGATLNEKTSFEDLEKIEIDKAVQRFHPHGYLEVIFNHPITKDEVEFQVSIKMKKDGTKVILLDPVMKMPIRDALDESRAKQEICEEWLKRNMEVEPTRDTDDGIFYDMSWGHIYCAAAEHLIHSDLEGGIHISYGDEIWN